MIAIKDLRELYKINPNISVENLIMIAEYYADLTRNCVDDIRNIGDRAKIFYNGRIEIKDYKKKVNNDR